MKRLFYSVFAMGVFLMMSCSHTDTPAPPTTDVIDADAEGAAAGWHENDPHGAGEVIIGTIHSVFSAVGESLESGQSQPFISTGNPNGELPEQYLLSNNPYEDFGIMHNRLLNLAIKEGGINVWLQKQENYDSIFYDKVLSTSTNPLINSTTAKPELFNTLKVNAMSASVQSAKAHLHLYSSQNDILSYLGLNSSETDGIKRIYTTFLSMKNNNSSKIEVAIYLNKEISEILNNEVLTDNQRTEIIYLTVLKHSNYFWSLD